VLSERRPHHRRPAPVCRGVFACRLLRASAVGPRAAASSGLERRDRSWGWAWERRRRLAGGIPGGAGASGRPSGAVLSRGPSARRCPSSRWRVSTRIIHQTDDSSPGADPFRRV